mgnify:CR=1 FL=1
MRNSLPGKYEGFGEKKYSGWVKESRYVPGFDGTRLAVDIVRPADENGKAAGGKFPTIMLISRGGRFGEANTVNGVNIIDHCVPYGYVGVVVEMRGCGASFGTNDSFSSIENRRDVNTLFDWVAEQPWSDGQVATYGGSNRGLIQFASAVTKPAPSPALKGITPVVSNPDFYYQDYPNGVSAIPKRKVKKLSGSGDQSGKKTKEEFLKKVVPVDDDPDGSLAYEAYENDQYGKNRNFMEWLLLDNMCRDDGNPNFGGEKTNLTIPPVTDMDVFEKTDIRVHQFAGLLESGTFGQLMAAKEWGGSIVLGPWDHRQSRSGNPDMPEGMFDFCAEHLKWFDNLLKGVDNGFDQRPPFIYYNLHGEEGKLWRCSDTWPLENVRPATFYLSPEKSGTCASVNDGTLSQVKPEQETRTAYRVDTSIQVFDNGEGATFDRMHLCWDGDMTRGVDNKGLTFTSLPLFERYCNEIAGCTSVDLWVTCSQNDADFVVYLEEVLENGESRYVSMGCQRASHRTSEPRASWDEAGATYHPSRRADMERCLAEGMEKPVHLAFAIEPVAYTFAPGSRLRITVTCANKGAFQHPMYDEEKLPTIHLLQGADYASSVRIPFVEHEENVYNGTVAFGDYQGPGTLYFFEKNVYLYYNGTWRRYAADSEEMRYELRGGVAYFEAGFRFRMEGLPERDGILQDYRGGEKPVIPFPYKRRLLVDRVPVAPHQGKLYLPDVKSLYLEEFRMDSETEDGEALICPAILYIHGYSKTTSRLELQQREFLKHGYAVIGIDMRNYPPNCFPDYLYDIKGCTRYVRAGAQMLRINPDRLGCSGQSLGGNAALLLGVTGGNPEWEGTVGGNEGVSSRLQAIDVGYGWSDLLNLGADLLDEYRYASEEVKRRKFNNTDGPNAPAAGVIGFMGPGKGLKVLRDYEAEGHEGTDEELDRMLNLARKASPINYITPDCPPAALFTGLGMMRVDIPDRQSYRTFEAYNRVGADCYLFGNTNGNYGLKPEVIQGILTFFDHWLKEEITVHKSVMKPDSRRIVEDYCDCTVDEAPVVRRDGELFVSAEYARRRFGATDAVFAGNGYVPAAKLEGSSVGFRYYPDSDMAVLIPADQLQDALPKKRA